MVLTILYNLYLDVSDGSIYYPDFFTHLVAVQTENLLNSFDYETLIFPHPDEPSIKLFLNGNYLARIIEGCNAISIIILFVSFIVAFSGRVKTTLFYILSGIVLIYVVNLLRIVILTLGLYHYPEYSNLLHNVVFPGIIYGMVFMLWVFWVNRFTTLNKKHA